MSTKTLTRAQARDAAWTEHNQALAASARIFDARVLLLRDEQSAEAVRLLNVFIAALDAIDHNLPEGSA